MNIMQVRAHATVVIEFTAQEIDEIISALDKHWAHVRTNDDEDRFIRVDHMLDRINHARGDMR